VAKYTPSDLLALWAVKLKLVAYNPTHYAKLSISSGEDISDRLAEIHNTRRFIFLKVNVRSKDKDAGDADKETKHDTLSTNTSIKTFYYETHVFHRGHLRDLVRYALYSILDKKALQRGTNSTCFQACTVVYKAGLESVLTAVNQDRFGTVSFSSEPPDISNLYTGMLLLRSNLEAIESKNQELYQTDEIRSRSIAASVKWDWPVKRGDAPNPRDRSTFLYSIDDLLSVAIWQALSTLYTAKRVTNLIQLVSSGATVEDPILPFSSPPRWFQPMIHISTEEYLRDKTYTNHQQPDDDDVRYLAQSPLRHVRGMSSQAERPKRLSHADPFISRNKPAGAGCFSSLVEG
jgi:hypothetical protein